VLGQKTPHALTIHQYGTSKMPKRQIIYEPNQFAERLAILAADYVSDGRVK